VPSIGGPSLIMLKARVGIVWTLFRQSSPYPVAITSWGPAKLIRVPATIWATGVAAPLEIPCTRVRSGGTSAAIVSNTRLGMARTLLAQSPP
jgi:hypothetical protein